MTQFVLELKKGSCETDVVIYFYTHIILEIRLNTYAIIYISLYI